MFDLHVLTQFFNDFAGLGTAVVAAIAAWWGFAKFLLPLLREVHVSFKQLDIISAEFRTNGGSSLRDAINRLEGNIKGIREDAVKMEARQWAVIATLRDPIFESNPEGLCVRANPAYLALIERPMEDILGNGWENIIHPEDRARVWNEWNDAIARQRTFESTYRIKSFHGVIYNVSCIAIPYFSIDNSDQPIGYIGRFETVRKINQKT